MKEKEETPKHSKLPWIPDVPGYSQYIFGAEGQMIVQARGWGYLTGTLGLTEKEAMEVQKANIDFIIKACNTYYEREKENVGLRAEVERLKSDLAKSQFQVEFLKSRQTK